MASELMPDWIRFLAQGNPVNWAVHGSRLAMAGEAWLSVLSYGGLLLLFAILAGVLATQAFRFYRRSI
jgi:ABC-2 type transport system permease protein